MVDEATTTLYLIAIGLHTHHRLPDARWVVPSLWVGVVAYVVGIYCIYYFLIVVSKTGNSQHYVGQLDVVDDPVHGPALRRRPAAASTLPPWLRAGGHALAQVIRRDFINLGSLVVGLADQYLFIYATMLAGGLGLVIVVAPDHLRLRRQLAELRRRGAKPRLLPS